MYLDTSEGADFILEFDRTDPVLMRLKNDNVGDFTELFTLFPNVLFQIDEQRWIAFHFDGREHVFEDDHLFPLFRHETIICLVPVQFPRGEVSITALLKEEMMKVYFANCFLLFSILSFSALVSFGLLVFSEAGCVLLASAEWN